MTSQLTLDKWVQEILAGDVRALARAISLVERRGPEARELLRALSPRTGRARILGLTGAPGTGKSTLVDALTREYRKGEMTVGIIAVDPSSPYSGGAILGDRVRMQSHGGDPGVFIRSMATRGSLGGLAAATADVAAVIDASNRDLVMIETVGVGQNEVDIVKLADVTMVVIVPGMGDVVQSLKAGIMEIADIFVINKSDREGADRLEREVREMLSLSHRQTQWTPPVIRTVACDGVGIVELKEAISRYEEYLQNSGMGARRRIENWRARLEEMLREEVLRQLVRTHLDHTTAERYATEIAERTRDPYTLVDEIIASLSAGKGAKPVR